MRINEKQNGHSKNIIYVSSIPWNFSWHRQQEMMDYMANHGFCVLFVEPCDKKHPFSHYLKQEKKNIWCFRPMGLPFERCLHSVNHINARLSKSELKKAVSVLQLEKPLVWLDRVHGFDFEYFQKNSFVVYDLIDEILAFGRVRNDKMLIALENRVLKRADILLSSSKTLMERKIEQCGRKGKSLFLPNGVDCARFMDVPEKAPKSPNEQLVLGFVGDISPRRIDYSLIRSVAVERPKWRFLFIGPGKKEDKNKLKHDISNIEVRDAVLGTEIPKAIREFDVGIIPYNIEKTDMDYVFPRKACEYLAAGRPVVSTPLKEIECLIPYVQVGSDAKNFIRKVEDSVNNNRITVDARRAFVQKYDWNFLMKELVTVLSQPNEND